MRRMPTLYWRPPACSHRILLTSPPPPPPTPHPPHTHTLPPPLCSKVDIAGLQRGQMALMHSVDERLVYGCFKVGGRAGDVVWLAGVRVRARRGSGG